MDSGSSSLIFFSLLIVMPLVFFLHAKNVRVGNNQNKYKKLKGKKLKFKSTAFNGNHYGFCVEYVISDKQLGIRCYVPSFNLVVNWHDIKLSKSRALIGSVVCLEIPNYSGKIEISHKLAKEIEKFSCGKFGYARI